MTTTLPSKTQGYKSYQLATVEDVKPLMHFFRLMLCELYEMGYGIAPTKVNLATYWVTVLKPALLRGEHGIALAWCDEVLVGIYACTPEESRFELEGKRAFAHGIWVHPSYRKGRHIGQELQRFVHAHLRALGYTTLTSYITTNNVPAQVSAKVAGWNRIGHIVNLKLQD